MDSRACSTPMQHFVSPENRQKSPPKDPIFDQWVLLCFYRKFDFWHGRAHKVHGRALDQLDLTCKWASGLAVPGNIQIFGTALHLGCTGVQVCGSRAHGVALPGARAVPPEKRSCTGTRTGVLIRVPENIGCTPGRTGSAARVCPSNLNPHGRAPRVHDRALFPDLADFAETFRLV